MVFSGMALIVFILLCSVELTDRVVQVVNSSEIFGRVTFSIFGT